MVRHIKKGIFGPVFLDSTIKSANYRTDILDDFVSFLQWLDIIEDAWFQQDGARPHTSDSNLDFLNEHFGERVLSNRYLERFLAVVFVGPHTRRIWTPAIIFYGDISRIECIKTIHILSKNWRKPYPLKSEQYLRRLSKKLWIISVFASHALKKSVVDILRMFLCVHNLARLYFTMSKTTSVYNKRFARYWHSNMFPFFLTPCTTRKYIKSRALVIIQN